MLIFHNYFWGIKMTSAKYQFLREQYAKPITELLLTLIENKSMAHMAFPNNPNNSRLPKMLESLQDQINFDDEPNIFNYRRVFDAFAKELDPTHDRNSGKAWKYLHWICEQFLEYRHNGKPMLIEDFYKHRDNLRDFDAWSAQLHRDGQPNQIDDIRFAGGAGQENGFHALQRVLRPYQHAREAKRLKNEFRRLNDQDRKEIEDGTSVLYDGVEGRVLMIHNWAASKYWGTHTEWCITYKETDEHFRHYHPDNPIIFYMPVPTEDDIRSFQDHKSFKFAAVEGHIWDEHDQTQIFGFPDCFHRLALALREHYEDKPECLDFLDGYGRAKMIVDDTIDHKYEDTKVRTVQAKEMDWDDFDRVLQALDDIEPNIDNNRLLPLISERLRNDPDFLIEALKVQRHTASYGNVETLRISEIDEFKAHLANDPSFMYRALATYGKVYFDLPRDLRQREDIALKALERYPIGIIDILSNATTINNMYSEVSDRGLSLCDKKMRFFEKSMITNPSVIEFMDYVQGIQVSDIPDQAWLNALDAHPQTHLSYSSNWREWFERYSKEYSGDMDDEHSPRELVLRSIKFCIDNNIRKYDTHTTSIFSALSSARRYDVIQDPEVLSYGAYYSYHWVKDDLAKHPAHREILMEALKRDSDAFNALPVQKCAGDPQFMKELLTHVIDKGQQLKFAKHLRHLSFSSTKHPETLMSCEAVLQVIERAFPDLEPWPDFQEVINAYRSAHDQPQNIALAQTRRLAI